MTRGPDSSTLPLDTVPPTVVAAPLTQLVLRKPDVAARPVHTRATAPSISTSPTGVIARQAAAPVAPTAPSEGTWRGADSRTIEWIADLVASRLAHRLEIDRERMGGQPWRQVS